VITRVADGRILFDPRTLPEASYDLVGGVLKRALEE
jgi:hypothetical protein